VTLIGTYNLNPAHSRARKASASPAEAGLGHFAGFHVNLTFGEVNVECAVRPEIFGSPVIIGG
jgi:hypothetical protein